MDAFSNPYADAMSWLAQQIPKKRDIGARDRCRDISGGISKAYREHLGLRRCREKRWAEGKDAPPIGCCALRVDHNSLAWVLLDEGLQVGKFYILWRLKSWILESAKHGMEQGNVMHKTG